MTTKITSARWAPDGGIPGMSKGVFTFTTNGTVRVVGFEHDQTYPAGTHKINVNRTPPTTNSLTHVFIFYRGTQRFYTYTIRMLGHPLIAARWIPTYPYDKNSIIRSSMGTLKFRAVGVQQIGLPQFDLPTTTIPSNGSLDIPVNLPVSITQLVRNELNLYVELFIRANVLADGQTKPVNLKVIFG